MICQYCQNQYPDNCDRCPTCGTANPAFAPQQQPSSPEVHTAPFTGQPALPRPPYPTAVEIIKKIGQSKLFLATAILYTICAAISLVSSGVDIMAIVNVVAVWLFFSESRKNTGPYEMNVSSLKALKIMKTINIVLLIVAFGLVALAMLLVGAIAMASGSTGGRYVFIICLMFILFFGIMVAFSLALNIGLKSYYKGALEAVETGLRPKKLSSFAPIWLMISGILSILTSIAMLILVSVLKSVFLDELINSYMGQLSPYLEEAAKYGLSYSFSSIFSGVQLYTLALTGIAGSVCNILIGKVFLDAKKLVAESYFPSEEEAFYYKREYYAAKQAAEAEAQARYQAQYRASYQQYQQTYGQNQGQQYQQTYTPNAGQQYQQPYAQPGAQQQGQYQAPYGQGGNGNTQQNYGQQNNNDPW